ncbi:MAG: DUF5916 domain-containing protein [Aquabacterium sp.]
MKPLIHGAGALALAAVLLGAPVLHAQPAATTAAAAAEGPIVAARLQPGETIKLDGTLTHPAWQRAVPYDRFVVEAPRGAAMPPYRTEVRLLYSDQALYVGVKMTDPRPAEIRAPLVRRDTVNRTQDFVVVYVDGVGQRRSAQFFRISAAGILADGMHTADDDNEDFSPDFDHDGAAARQADGWSAVLRLPFSTLRYTGAGAAPWRIMVARRVPRDQFWLLTSVKVPVEAGNFIAGLQPLQGVQLPAGAGHLTLRPSLTLRREQQQDAGQPRTTRRHTEASLDVKWRPLPELVLDATLKPDFSQVALDVPQLQGNTRFALSFPEKRPFFFESSDLLRSPTEALYTRSLTEPRWGLRATWRAPTLQGSGFVIDDKGRGFTLLPGPFGTGVAEQPASTTLAGRVQSTREGLQVGLLTAARRYEGGRGDNTVLGPDMTWQIDDNWRARAQWLHARTDALPDNAGGLARGPQQVGNRLYATLVRQSDLRNYDVTVEQTGADFRHDTGFVAQAGVRMVEAHAGFGWRGVGLLNELWLNLNANQVTTLDNGTVVQRYFTPGLWMNGPSNFELNLQLRGVSYLRGAANGPLLSERYLYANMVVTPVPWMPILEVNAQLGRRADVVANQARDGGRLYLGVRTRPWPGVEIEPSYTLDVLREGGQAMYRETAAQLLAVWHWDAARSLRAIVQHPTLRRLAEPGVSAYDDAGTVGSLTASWRRSSGTVFYLGASRSRQGVQAVGRGNEVFLKMQVDVDEMRAAW